MLHYITYSIIRVYPDAAAQTWERAKRAAWCQFVGSDFGRLLLFRTLSWMLDNIASYFLYARFDKRVRSLRMRCSEFDKSSQFIIWVALLVQCYLSNAASFVLRVAYSVKDHHDLLHVSPLFEEKHVLDK